MTRGITDDERAVLRAIAAYQTRMAGQSPALAWVSTVVCVPYSRAEKLLNGLEKRGLIRRAQHRGGMTRTIEIMTEI